MLNRKLGIQSLLKGFVIMQKQIFSWFFLISFNTLGKIFLVVTK